jgi:trehalose 6-phosphate phosphatase
MQVKDLKETTMEKMSSPSSTDAIPSALEHMKEMGNLLTGKEAVVFIDYDGTLTPIVERPEQAVISEEMRQALRDLAEKCTVAIVSGRDLSDVQNMVGIEGIVYAGSHGFDISSPLGDMDYQQGIDYLPALDRAEQSLKHLLKGIPGCEVERKRFAIAVHFRRVAESQVAKVESTVDDVLSAHENLRKTGGKKIFELRPDIEWDKGKAINWILQKLNLDREDVLPFYIGDDLTDEDAFRELRQEGITVLVRDETRPTLAHYALDNTEDVRLFLQIL